MVQVFSKYPPIYSSCKEFLHPWTESFSQHICETSINSFKTILRINTTFNMIGLLLKGKIPTLNDLRKFLFSTLRSTIFLSTLITSFSVFLYLIRHIQGNFNFLTVAGVPAFISSILSIQMERSDRRVLLALYTANLATQIFWNLLTYRGIVKSIKYGQVGIFAASLAVLLALAKSGKTKVEVDGKEDEIFKILRFVVGPYEDKLTTEQTILSEQQKDYKNLNNATSFRDEDNCSSSKKSNFIGYRLLLKAVSVYKRFIVKIKEYNKHNLCQHPFSCLYYVLQASTKMFFIGAGIQLGLKLITNIKMIMKHPKTIKGIIFKRDNLNIALFLSGASGVFRAIMCLLRTFLGVDGKYNALVAGLVAGLTFFAYPNKMIALYVFWRMLYVLYNLGISEKYLLNVPGFPDFLISLSTAIVFHSALVEPATLPPGYWKYLLSVSGGRIGDINRELIDCWGLNSSKAVRALMVKTKYKQGFL